MNSSNKNLDFKKVSVKKYSVKPLGNAPFDYKRNLGFFEFLSDEQIIEFLESLPVQSIVKLSATSKTWYCLGNHDDLWRSLYIANWQHGLDWVFDWKSTFIKRYSGKLVKPSEIQCNIYSDYLFGFWRCASVDLDDLCAGGDNIDRLQNLSLDDFMKKYCIPNKPVIVTDVVEKWPCFKKWSFDYFINHHADSIFQCEAISMTFSQYYSTWKLIIEYSLETKEEAPLYLFDKSFNKYALNDYSVPEYFQKDLFQLLPNRPDHQWLIIGPARSGSTFHIDPNSTSAWNAVIKGKKKWILYPPHVIPPGVFPSDNRSSVTSPVSVIDWYLNFYDPQHVSKYGIECICNPGEIIFVPCGWWHSVINLEPTIAITQNFVNDGNLEKVMNFLKTKPDQVSGYCKQDLYSDFKDALDKEGIFVPIKKRKPAIWDSISGESTFEFKF